VTWEAPDERDADRLRYIAENPEVLRYLYDVFGHGKLKKGHDPLVAMRDVMDEQIRLFPDGDV
jgi:hypothetical protein